MVNWSSPGTCVLTGPRCAWSQSGVRRVIGTWNGLHRVSADSEVESRYEDGVLALFSWRRSPHQANMNPRSDLQSLLAVAPAKVSERLH